MKPSPRVIKQPLRVIVCTPDLTQTQQWAAELHQQSQALALPLEVLLSSADGQVQGTRLPLDDAPADYAIGWKPEAKFFAAHPQIKAFFNAGAGVDYFLNNPEVTALIPPALPIIRLEDAGMAQQMIDYCRHQVLDWMYSSSIYQEQQQRQVWIEQAAPRRADFPIGVFGLGVLGAALAQSFARDGFPVLGHARRHKLIEGVHFEPQLESFLAKTKILILLAPATAQTRHVMHEASFALLPRGAYLINVARGALVHEPSLLKALDGGHLKAACLDVFEQEPLPAANPLWRHPRIRITPHSSAATHIDEAAKQILKKIIALQAGENVSGKVDLDRGY